MNIFAEMQWCTCVGNILWALLTIPLCLPLSLILFLFAAICGLCGEFLLWILPRMAFPKGLISVGNNLISSAKKILGWCLPMTLFEHATRREEQRGGATIPTFNPMETQRVSIQQSTLTENENVIFGFPKIGFTYEELTVACNGFSDSTFIGSGGFGSVHKGGLDDGREIAIKQLNADSRCGDRDFIAEVDVLSRVHHRHLVQLIGCCITKESKMLVCEYVPNKTLEFHLHKRSESLMDWSTRLKIAIGSAKALSYLHEDCQPRIIHRDIKAANILLENSFEAKVADFGLARFFPDGETHVYATQVVGTRGYLAPEYASTGEIREQYDTYSYGVVLLELITGKTPLIRTDSGVECLVDWARQLLLQALVDHNYHDIVDPRLANNYNSEEMKLMVACASSCVRQSPQSRPPMSQVVLVLEGIATLDTLGDEPIRSSGDLTRGSRHSMSGYTTTDDMTTDISMNLETEYITAYINSTTSFQIPYHVASMNQTVSQDERTECVDFPADEVASSGTMTAVVSRIDATGRDLERSSMDMLLSGENSGNLTKQSTENQAHSLNTEYVTAEMSSVKS